MAILGFPSSAIIGNLDWTGDSSSLVASNWSFISAPTTLDISQNGQDSNTSLHFENGGGTTINAYNTSISISAEGNNSIVSINGDAAASVTSGGNINVTATETLNLTGGNNISGGVNITSQQAMSLTANNGILNASAGDTSLSLDGVHAKLSWGAGNYIQVGEEFAEIQCGNTIVNGSNTIELNTGGAVLVTGNAFKFNNAKIATQPFAIAAAVALG